MVMAWPISAGRSATSFKRRPRLLLQSRSSRQTDEALAGRLCVGAPSVCCLARPPRLPQRGHSLFKGQLSGIDLVCRVTQEGIPAVQAQGAQFLQRVFVEHIGFLCLGCNQW